MKKLRVLLVGAAFSADLHSDGYSRIRDKVEIVGICDKNMQQIEALANRYGFTGYTAYDNYDEAIAQCDCDLVDICMPNFLHHDVAVKALNAGRNIICEKPLATTVEDAQDMVDTAARLGKHIYYAEDWLFAPAFRKSLENTPLIPRSARSSTHRHIHISHDIFAAFPENALAQLLHRLRYRKGLCFLQCRPQGASAQRKGHGKPDKFQRGLQ